MGLRVELAATLDREVRAAHIRQVDLAGEVGVSVKHLCQLLQGKAGCSTKLADAILTACGRTVVVSTAPLPTCARNRCKANAPRQLTYRCAHGHEAPVAMCPTHARDVLRDQNIVCPQCPAQRNTPALWREVPA